ncbi:MAG: DUF917 domain-containing protein [Candidatus Bathyarchaeia archaeon]
MQILDREDAEDLVVGATILGTGGGGNPKEGLKLLLNALDLGYQLKLIAFNELKDDALVVCPYDVGTVAPTAKTKKKVTIQEPMKLAIEKMEKMVGKKVLAAVASELGGSNTPIALHIAASLGLPLVDGDLLGRAAPELHQCTVHIFDVAMYPSVIVGETGNIVVVERYSDIDDYEALARYLSMLAGRFVAVVDTPMNGALVKKVAIENTVSKCIRIGRAVREANRGGLNPVDAVVKETQGWLLFKGRVEKYNWKDEGGFLIGEAHLKGINDWSNRTFKTWIKNEHIMAWMDGKPAVMPPDLIMFVDEKGYGITNSELREGVTVNVVGAKAPEVWRTQKGLKFFGPRHFGFDVEYIPIEDLIKSLK